MRVVRENRGWVVVPVVVVAVLAIVLWVMGSGTAEVDVVYRL